MHAKFQLPKWLQYTCPGWLFSDYNASLSSNWTEFDWTGTELGNMDSKGNWKLGMLRNMEKRGKLLKLFNSIQNWLTDGSMRYLHVFVVTIKLN